ncbi:hypothetical protein B0H17DRAFT_1195391 [Mycena rosella]|uniref:Uncharacterized protein n=1 Tax=Mycena rosella TaxID=1033263 RepID=A0AAD7DYN9_MYCRO|nr:hypothetical protein B0H17DRAFT_1195391 [Mycena rosella]
MGLVAYQSRITALRREVYLLEYCHSHDIKACSSTGADTKVPGDVKLLPLPEDEFQKGAVKEHGVLDNFHVRILPVLGPLPDVLCELVGKPIANPGAIKNQRTVYERPAHPTLHAPSIRSTAARRMRSQLPPSSTALSRATALWAHTRHHASSRPLRASMHFKRKRPSASFSLRASFSPLRPIMLIFPPDHRHSPIPHRLLGSRRPRLRPSILASTEAKATRRRQAERPTHVAVHPLRMKPSASTRAPPARCRAPAPRSPHLGVLDVQVLPLRLPPGAHRRSTPATTVHDPHAATHARRIHRACPLTSCMPTFCMMQRPQPALRTPPASSSPPPHRRPVGPARF